MSTYYIVKIDISSKQKYIFSSNKLKEIIGASAIIKFVTEELGGKVLEALNKNKIDFVDLNGNINTNGNVLFEAGGNSMYIFTKEDEAIEFNKAFSKFVMQYFDGLELVIVMQKFNMQVDAIDEIYDSIESKLTVKKGIRKNEFKRIGYGLTKLCTSTRKPAGYNTKEGNVVSKESNDKLTFFEIKYGKYEKDCVLGEIKIKKENLKELIDEKSNEQLKEKLKSFDFTDELDIIAGKLNEGSYIGITCIDGNGMGKKINRFNENFRNHNTFKGNEEKFNINYIKEFNKLTKEIKDKYLEAFADTIEELIKNYDNYCKKINFNSTDKIVPLRPIIMAGDDVTFVSNGKIAIDATRIFTEKITEKKVQFGDKSYNLTTSAGISIVKRNHPFFRAVKLAGELEKSSKKRLKKIKEDFQKLSDKYNYSTKGEYDASLIDWHIDRGNSSGELADIRNKSYENIQYESAEHNQDLVARPYIVSIGMEEALLNNKIHNEDVEKLKAIMNFNFDNFFKVLNAVNSSEMKSNLKGFFRTMNLSDIDSELFALKYNLQNEIKGDFNVRLLKQVVYDAIDTMDLYVGVKGEHKND